MNQRDELVPLAQQKVPDKIDEIVILPKHFYLIITTPVIDLNYWLRIKIVKSPLAIGIIKRWNNKSFVGPKAQPTFTKI